MNSKIKETLETIERIYPVSERDIEAAYNLEFAEEKVSELVPEEEVGQNNCWKFSNGDLFERVVQAQSRLNESMVFLAAVKKRLEEELSDTVYSMKQQVKVTQFSDYSAFGEFETQ